MSEPEKKLIIDSDWKSQAAAEKEKLSEKVEAETPPPEEPMPTFETLVSDLAIQAMAGLGLVKDPSTGQPLPTDPFAAKFHIELLGMLEEKTRGNLDETEKTLINRTLYQLRMAFVQLLSR